MPNRTEASVTKAHSICHRETTVTAPVLYSTRIVLKVSPLGRKEHHRLAYTPSTNPVFGRVTSESRNSM